MLHIITPPSHMYKPHFSYPMVLAVFYRKPLFSIFCSQGPKMLFPKMLLYPIFGHYMTPGQYSDNIPDISTVLSL